tara:strand:- start:310 stop:564 length:255 start_codon:yes stop_codon:yes gene_type:complete
MEKEAMEVREDDLKNLEEQGKVSLTLLRKRKNELKRKGFFANVRFFLNLFKRVRKTIIQLKLENIVLKQTVEDLKEVNKRKFLH